MPHQVNLFNKIPGNSGVKCRCCDGVFGWIIAHILHDGEKYAGYYIVMRVIENQLFSRRWMANPRPPAASNSKIVPTGMEENHADEVSDSGSI